DERAARDRVGVLDAAQDDDREDEREPEREVADAGLRQRGGRLALLEPRDRVRRRIVAVDDPPRDEPCRREPGEARDDDGAEEEPDDEDELRERPREGNQIDEVAHATRKLAVNASASSSRTCRYPAWTAALASPSWPSGLAFVFRVCRYSAS